MKIGVVCHPTVGGSGVVATMLGVALSTRGHDVHFIAYDLPFRLESETESAQGLISFHPVDVIDYDLFRYPDYALPLASRIADVAIEQHLDVIHVHYAVPHAVSAYLAKQLVYPQTLPVVTTLHGTDVTFVGRDPAFARLVKFSIEHSDAVTAVSQHLEAMTRHAFQIDYPIEVISNFFTPQQQYLGLRAAREEFVTESEKLVVHASNFRSVKRVHDVVEVFARIRKALPAKLLLLGTGNDIDTVKSQVRDLKLAEDVIFFGPCRDSDPYLSSADVVLLPSSQESFGLVALEAMAYGVPTVASNVGGLKEVIEHGVSGFLSPVGDVAGMAENTIRLLTDPVLYDSVRRAAIARAALFTTEKIVPLYENLYTRLCPR